jgi:hypothetical protein
MQQHLMPSTEGSWFSSAELSLLPPASSLLLLLLLLLLSSRSEIRRKPQLTAPADAISGGLTCKGDDRLSAWNWMVGRAPAPTEAALGSETTNDACSWLLYAAKSPKVPLESVSSTAVSCGYRSGARTRGCCIALAASTLIWCH